MPSLSIIIPMHNRAAELPQTLESVLEQTSGDWEAIVVDDHSTDDSHASACGFAEKDQRIRVLKLPDARTGAPSARNFGVENSTGELVVFLDSDDLLAPDCVAGRLAFMAAHPELDFSVSRTQTFQHAANDLQHLWNKDTGEDDLLRFLRSDMPWATAAPTWRRSALARLGPWDEEAMSAQDWEFHTRAVAIGLMYARREAIDNYWRVQGLTRETIGSQAWVGKQHALNRPGVISRALAHVRRAGRLDARARERFATLYFWAAERIAFKVSRRQALAAWQQARREGVVGVRPYWAAAWYLFNFRRKKLARQLRRNLSRRWPVEFAVYRCPWFLRAPLDGNPPPTISVVVSVYNNAAYLAEAIGSIQAQSFRDWEMIVVDDGSTDGSGELLRDFAAGECRMKLIQRANKGLTVSLNEALAAARGEFIARMDGDDVADPWRFEKQVDFLHEHPDVVIVGTQVELIDPCGVRLERPAHATDHAAIDAQLLGGQGWAIVHPTAMMRRDAVEKVGRYREDYNNVEDLDLFLKLAEVGRVANLPEVLLKYRKHPGSVNALRFENQKRLNKNVREDACKRRGLPMPTDFPFDGTKQLPRAEQFRMWGWWALKSQHIDAARQHARTLLKMKPLWKESWRLAYCAWRGR